MAVDYEILLHGNNLRTRHGFLGLANATLIHGEDGPILFDTGGYISRHELLKALADRGLQPDDVKMVFLSHLHFDHCHNIDLFPKAKVLVSKSEWDYAKQPHEKDLFMPWGLHAQLEEHDLELIEGDGAITGAINYFPAPGHTPGCYAMSIETADKGKAVIAGDSIKYAKEVVNCRCDMAFDTVERGTQSIRKILDMADRIIPGHFAELIHTDNDAFTWEDGVEFPLIIR